MPPRLLAVVALLSIPAGSAFAHPGDHTRHTISEALAHLLDADHLALLAVAVIIVVACYRLFAVRSERAKAVARANPERRP